MAGTVLSRSRHVKDIDSKVAILETIFMPIFFISLGMLVDINALGLFLFPILGLVFLAIVSKVIGSIIAGQMQKFYLIDSLIVGVGMAPRGAIGLIVAALGLTTGILNQSQFSVISAMAVLTSLIVPFILTPLLKQRYKEKLTVPITTQS